MEEVGMEKASRKNTRIARKRTRVKSAKRTQSRSILIVAERIFMDAAGKWGEHAARRRETLPGGNGEMYTSLPGRVPFPQNQPIQKTKATSTAMTIV